MRLLGISGSLRGDSLNGRLLAAGLGHAPDDWATSTYDALRHIPPFDADAEEPAPEAVAHLRAAIAEADAVLFSTPEYNSSIPGQLKNALDWASRPRDTSPLRFTPVAVIGASTGAFGAVWAQAELRKVLGASGARVVEGDLALGHAHEKWDPEGVLDEEVRTQLRELLAQLVSEAEPARVPV